MSGVLCNECNQGYLTAKTGTGRSWAYRRGFRAEIPDDMACLTCDSCQSVFIEGPQYEQMQELARTQFQETQKAHVAFLVSVLQNRGCRTQDIERACGVTFDTLRRVTTGRHEAPEPLIGQLEAFVLYPDEYHRRLFRESRFDTLSVLNRVPLNEESCKELLETLGSVLR